MRRITLTLLSVVSASTPAADQTAKIRALIQAPNIEIQLQA
jgi:hypothetical protein